MAGEWSNAKSLADSSQGCLLQRPTAELLRVLYYSLNVVGRMGCNALRPMLTGDRSQDVSYRLNSEEGDRDLAIFSRIQAAL